MVEIFERTQRLIGKAALEKLKNARIAVFGLGGVGGAAVEALARAGVGYLALFDGDTVSPTNRNRQIIATEESTGMLKTKAAAERCRCINPQIEIFEHSIFYTPENADEFPLSGYDYIIDAVDMVTAKIELICRAKESSTPIISCMGTGNKLDATAFEVCDIYKTSVCPLARVMRRELNKRGIDALKVVYSREAPREPIDSDDKRTPASISFVPPVAGMILAGEVIKDIIGK
ncbi:MAG: tRNA threonylcarbamoyladenosine dehydratase [Oscillospiraceae bacterium]|nr:tRNA threonylcarbamoyladenosine dehydratase [Oscillospiraceae bacterium]